AELKALKIEIEKKRKELKILEEKFAATSKDLEKLPGAKKPRIAETANPMKVKTITEEILAEALRQDMRTNPSTVSADALLKSLQQQIGAKPAIADTKSTDLEKKLDRLLKEVDELRREIRREKPADPSLRAR